MDNNDNTKIQEKHKLLIYNAVKALAPQYLEACADCKILEHVYCTGHTRPAARGTTSYLYIRNNNQDIKPGRKEFGFVIKSAASLQYLGTQGRLSLFVLNMPLQHLYEGRYSNYRCTVFAVWNKSRLHRLLQALILELNL